MDLKGLNEDIVDQLIVLADKDQRFRFSSTSNKDNWEAQNKLNMEVQLALAKLFDKHGYPGLSVVGEKYAGEACLLLEHGGQLAHQEKYYPLVAEAFKNGEAPRPYVLMLDDRIHWKKTKEQIFGSHVGVPLDSDAVIERVKKQLGW